jgi:heme-degrading monooxygenase HmoA
LEHEEGFVQHLRRTGIEDYEDNDGCLGHELWTRRDLEWTYFVLTSKWVSWEAIEAFAGSDPEIAVLYPGDEEFGLVPERTVHHYEASTLTALGD